MLAVLLAERNLTQARFADMVGVSKGQPSNLLSGRHRPPDDVEELTRWGAILGLTGQELDVFIEAALLEHAPDRIRERYVEMRAKLSGEAPPDAVKPPGQ